MTFTIQGNVVEDPTGTPIEGVRVEAWDKDFGTDDYLASAISGPDGKFLITFDESMFDDWGFERYPDLYFKVYRCGDLLANTEKSVIWNIKKAKTNVKDPGTS